MNNNRLIRLALILGLIVGVTFAFIYRDRSDGAAFEAWNYGGNYGDSLLNTNYNHGDSITKYTYNYGAITVKLR